MYVKNHKAQNKTVYLKLHDSKSVGRGTITKLFFSRCKKIIIVKIIKSDQIGKDVLLNPVLGKKTLCLSQPD